MSDDGDAFEYVVKMQRGDGTDDRDTHKTTVTAQTIDELRSKVEQARARMAEEIEETRDIQPDDTRSLADKQRSFDDVEGEA
jgi:hypothetical protein